MYKVQHGGKKGVKLMPNHFDYISNVGRYFHVSIIYETVKGLIVKSKGVTYDPFNKVIKRYAARNT